MQFTALKDFWCEELKSGYNAGLSYTLKSPDDKAIADDPAKPELHKRNALTRKNRAKLIELFPVWLQEGKVAIGIVQGPIHGAAKVEGSGEVS